MQSSTPLHVIAIAIAFGKAAIGGAGLMLAFLGGLNAFFGAIAHDWVRMLSHTGVESAVVPYLAIVGAIIGGLFGVFPRRKA